ncbi:3-carboxymuconate cyclase protein [Rutstroemia sp. NJR-2017a BBW]|nr:3-carboxymuconate cyclase protein [Rutstroemia sp. NJR-2017a BBW]
MYFPATKDIVSAALTTNLFVSSYIGTITTLQLSQYTNGSYSLKSLSVNNETTDNPAWLMKDPYNQVLYCANEYLPNSVNDGSISAYKIGNGGVLTLLEKQETVNGPVNTVLFNGGKNMAAAHYSGSALTTYTVHANGTISPLQTLKFTLAKPGPYPGGRQLSPHPHEALLDPTSQFLLVPDLGADLVRIFPINSSTSLVSESAPLVAPSGSGPRHGAFHVTSCNTTYFYLVEELGNTVTSYVVTYSENPKGMSFKQLERTSIYGNYSVPAGAAPAAAEIMATPDNKFMLTSSRNLTTLTNPPSDTLQTWTITPSGALSFTQLFPTDGDFPRQFSLNKAGNLVAVGLQRSGKVVIISRNVTTGLFEKKVAEIAIGQFTGPNNNNGQVTSVIFDE